MGLPVKFDYVGVDTKASYDVKGNRFYAQSRGIYMVSMSAGLMHGGKASYFLLNDGVPSAGLFRSSEVCNDIDTFGRDIIMDLHTLSCLRIFSNFTDGLYSDKMGLQTSFSVFRLTGLMKTEIFFSVSRLSTWDKRSEILEFPLFEVNTGGAYNQSNHYFRVPKTGIYFFSLIMCPMPRLTVDSEIRKNISVLGTLERYSNSHTSTDRISRSGLYHLTKNDLVFVGVTKTSRSCSGWGRDTSFSGFLYEPVHNIQRAWSVSINTSWYGKLFLSPVPFNEVLVNVPSYTWDKVRHHYRVVSAGIYYVTLTAGAQPGLPVYLSIMVNGERRASLSRRSTSHNGVDMLSRSIIMHLKAGQLVTIGAEGATAFYSTRERQTSFSGFLLFPY